MSRLQSLLALVLVCPMVLCAAPRLLDDQFELPPGFHIYKAAGAALTAGSYAIHFDGQGRLLVGDGTAIRRLTDRDSDGVFDDSEIIATGLGWRGPHGILVWGDKLYAVGGDGVQLFDGYTSASKLTHRRRLGAPLSTGGDHDAHTILRGFDGYLYLMAGNGSGISDRRHITQTNSPVLFEREAAVFRFDPEGEQWECIAGGGRNPPNLGLNYMGDFFSFDSDMEWHVGLPWYRPVRLNHWMVGGDQGWQEVGAYPPYFIDCLPGVLDVGRGSPTWGAFYEHEQFPARYKNAFLVCDYRWKSASNDQYTTGGRLMSFFLERAGATWKATAEVLASAKPGARDVEGRSINFALTGAEAGPDGSFYVSDHNQGIWRIFYNGVSSGIPQMVPTRQPIPATQNERLARLLALPQPGSEFSRLQQAELLERMSTDSASMLRAVALEKGRELDSRLRAIRLLAARAAELDASFLSKLAEDAVVEIRAQAALLASWRKGPDAVALLKVLLQDKEPFVRRRAVEGLHRHDWSGLQEQVLERLGDSERAIRYAAMTLLSHRPSNEWFPFATIKSDPQVVMRALVATALRRELPSQASIRSTFWSLLKTASNWNLESQLDFHRVVSMFQPVVEADGNLRTEVTDLFASSFPSQNSDLRWEEIRSLGNFQPPSAFPALLALLEKETDQVTQFHIAQSLSHFRQGWSMDEETRLFNWFKKNQAGWFADFAPKGVEFPLFWQTVLTDFGANHSTCLLERIQELDLSSQLGGVALRLLARNRGSGEKLAQLYRTTANPQAKIQIANAFKDVREAAAAAFLREAYSQTTDQALRGAIVQSLCVQAPDKSNEGIILAALKESNTDVARAAVLVLPQYVRDLDQALARSLISRLRERRVLAEAIESTLTNLARLNLPAGILGTDRTAREQRYSFFTNWFANSYKMPFVALARITEMSDSDVHQTILRFTPGQGDARKGLAVYERIQCNTCHGGGVTPGQEGKLFGPDLAGVFARLNREDLADSLVYPSKQVPDRFKAMLVELKNGDAHTGFITAQNDEIVTLATRDQVQQFERAKVASMKPQDLSLMPDHLLNALSTSDLIDLLGFLERGVPRP